MVFRDKLTGQVANHSLLIADAITDLYYQTYDVAYLQSLLECDVNYFMDAVNPEPLTDCLMIPDFLGID